MRNKNGVQILLVEDNEDDAQLTFLALKKNKLLNNLVHVKDGEQAVNFIFSQGIYAERKTSDFPKVILLDLSMPKMGGIEVLKKLKSDERTKHIPVVILTSSGENFDLTECYKLGANSYIVKPVIFEDFVTTIGQLGFYWFVLNEPML